MIPIGQLTEQIVLQQGTATTDGQGGYTTAWSTLATEWAKVTEVSYDRLMLDSGVKFEKVCQFDIRERGDTYTMGGEYRISWNSQVFTVYSVVTNYGMTTILAYVAV